MQIIMGIDPGSHNTGYGVIKAQGAKIIHLEHGVLQAPASKAFSERLHLIGEQLLTLFARVRPNVTVVEKVFLGRNADSAFKLGHMRGVCLFAAAQINSQLIEYATRSVKKGITGSGAAEKEQVQLVLFAALGIRGPGQIDSSDALALAYYHARMLEVALSLRQSREGVL